MTITFAPPVFPRFELVMQVRNHLGEPTGRTKSCTADDGYTLREFYEKNSWKKPNKKKKNKNKK